MLNRAFSLGLLIIILTYSNIFAQFSGGIGTQEDPYQISNLEQLQEINNYIDKHFVQINDIDASNAHLLNDSAGYIPIGSEQIGFVGIYDGANYEISNLSITGDTYVGLFGNVDGGTVKNINLKNSSITVDAHSGLLVGNNNGIVSNVSVSGTISGK